MRLLAPAVAALPALLAACTNVASAPGVAADHAPPLLTIETPERGTLSTTSSIEVTGRAIDAGSGIDAVTINGEPVELDADGRFSLPLELGEGITLLETVAVDGAGNEARDGRAVLGGELVDLSTPVGAGLVGHLGAQAIGGLGAAIGDAADAIDWTALARTYNPVAGGGGDSCNSYKATIDSVEHGGFAADTGATSGGISSRVRAVDLVVRGHLSFRALCAGGSASYTVTADAFDLAGFVAPRLESQTVAVDFESVTTRFTNFQLDVSGVPGFVENQLEGAVRDRVAQIIRDKATEVVPPLAANYLADFLARTWHLDLLGQSVDVSMWPSAMSWNAAGGTITLDATAAGDLGDGLYLSTPRPAPTEATLPAGGLAIGVADDVLDQLLAGLWSDGAFTGAAVPLDGDALAAVLGGDVAESSMTLSLPPVVGFDGDGAARLVIGDLILEAVDGSGATLARVAVSAEIDLVPSAGAGGVGVSVDTPRVLAQVLEQSPQLLSPLDADKVEVFAELAIRQLAGRADELLGSLPMPGVSNGALQPTSVNASGGYLVIGGDLAF